MACFWNKRIINKEVLYYPSSTNGSMFIDSSIQQRKVHLFLLSTHHQHFLLKSTEIWIPSLAKSKVNLAKVPSTIFCMVLFPYIRCSAIDQQLTNPPACTLQWRPCPRAKFLYCNVHFYRLIVCHLLEHTGTRWQFIILPACLLLNGQVLVKVTFAQV